MPDRNGPRDEFMTRLSAVTSSYQMQILHEGQWEFRFPDPSRPPKLRESAKTGKMSRSPVPSGRSPQFNDARPHQYVIHRILPSWTNAADVGASRIHRFSLLVCHSLKIGPPRKLAADMLEERPEQDVTRLSPCLTTNAKVINVPHP